MSFFVFYVSDEFVCVDVDVLLGVMLLEFGVNWCSIC